MPRKKFPANVVGPQIRKRRPELQLTQEQLAARCQMTGWDISRATLAQIESRFRYVSDEELARLAAVLKVSINDLFPASLRNPRQRKSG